MFKLFKKNAQKSVKDYDLIIARRNLLRVKVACETLLEDKELSEEDKMKIIDLARLDANEGIYSLQHFIKESE